MGAASFGSLHIIIGAECTHYIAESRVYLVEDRFLT